MLARRPEALVLAATDHSAATRRAAGSPASTGDRDRRAARAGDDAMPSASPTRRWAGPQRSTCSGSVTAGWAPSAPDAPATASTRAGEARLRGFVGTVREAGLPVALALAEGGLPNSYSQGAGAMAALLSQAPEVDAVFAISDLSAVGALMECHRRGIAVPERLSLLGFGDFEVGRQLVPPLSTIATDFPGMGRSAGRMVIELLAEGTAAPPLEPGGSTSASSCWHAAPRAPAAASPKRYCASKGKQAMPDTIADAGPRQGRPGDRRRQRHRPRRRPSPCWPMAGRSDCPGARRPP